MPAPGNLVRLNLRRPSTVVNAALVVVLLAGAFWGYETLHDPGGTAAAAAGAATRTVKVQQGTVAKTVTADGSVASGSTAVANFVTSGTVTEIDVRAGQAVKKGQVLAKVDPSSSQRALDAANADLDAADDSLSRTEAAGSDTSTAESAIEQAKLEVATAQATVDGCTLTAPMAGTVTAVNGTVGSSSSSSGSSTTTTTGGGSATGGTDSTGGSSSSTGFVEIQNLSKLEVTAAFAEADATGLKAGQAATITWNALDNASEPGRVASIDPSATTSNSVVTYGVTLSLDKLPAGVKVGQTTSVSITTGQAGNALFVNSAAITSVGTRHTVTVVSNGQQQAVEVEIGLVGDTTTQITSGVPAGAEVVLNTAASTSGSGGGFGGLGAAAGGPGGGTR